MTGTLYIFMFFSIDNSTIISPFRIRADECNYLWVMDTGLADIFGEGNALF